MVFNVFMICGGIILMYFTIFYCILLYSGCVLLSGWRGERGRVPPERIGASSLATSVAPNLAGGGNLARRARIRPRASSRRIEVQGGAGWLKKSPCRTPPVTQADFGTEGFPST